MKQIWINRRGCRRGRSLPELLPRDPRDTDIVRAKALRRRPAAVAAGGNPKKGGG